MHLKISSIKNQFINIINLIFFSLIFFQGINGQDWSTSLIKTSNAKKNEIIKFSDVDFSRIELGTSLDLARMDVTFRRTTGKEISPLKDYDILHHGKNCYYGKKSNDKWDVIGLDGSLLFDTEFIDVVCIDKNIFLIRNDENKFGVINTNKDVFIPFNYKFIDIMHYRDSLLLGYSIDGTKQIFSPEGKVLHSGDFLIEDGFIKEKNLTGLITSNFIIKPYFDEVRLDNNGNNVVFKFKDKSGIILADGKISYPLDFDFVGFYNKRITFSYLNKNTVMLYDHNMKQFFDSKITGYVDNNDNTFFVEKNRKWFWVDSLGKPVKDIEFKARPELFRYSSIYKNIYYYTSNGINYYFNKASTLPDLKEYSNVKFMNSLPFYVARKKGNLDILNRFFKKIITIKNTDVITYDGKFLFKENDKFVLMDTLGNRNTFHYNIKFTDSIISKESILKLGSLKYYKENEKIGILYKGKWTIPFIDKIENLNYSPSSFIYDKLIFKANNIIGFLTNDTLIYPTLYTSIYDQIGLMKANKVNTFDVLDLKGKLLLHDLEIHHKIFNYGVKGDVPIFYKHDENGKLIIKENLIYVYQIANTIVFRKDDKFGVLNEDLKIILEPIFKNISYLFYNGMNYIMVENDNNKFGLYSSKGVELLKPTYDAIYSKYPDVIVLKSDKTYNFDQLLKLERYDSLFIK